MSAVRGTAGGRALPPLRHRHGQNPASNGVRSSGAGLSLLGALGPSLLLKCGCLNWEGVKRERGRYQFPTKPVGLMETKREISENLSTGCSSELLILSSDNKMMSFPKHEWTVSVQSFLDLETSLVHRLAVRNARTCTQTQTEDVQVCYTR